MTPEQEDSVKFLRLLLSECVGTDHSWRTCRRCLALSHIEGHQKIARRLLERAIQALESQS